MALQTGSNYRHQLLAAGVDFIIGARFAEQLKASAQRQELAADLADGLAVVLPEVGDCQPTSSMSLALKMLAYQRRLKTALGIAYLWNRDRRRS